MPVVTGFNSFDEMTEYMAERQRKAKEAISPVQAAMQAGDHYLVDSGLGFFIFGEIRERPQANGFCFCMGYSVACPEGELGDVHLSSMVPIEPDEFEAVEARGWTFPELVVAAIQRLMQKNSLAKRTN